MKTYLYPLLASLCLPLYAASPASQTTTTPIQTPPAPTPYAVTQKDANSSVWQRTVYETGPSGQVVSKTHSYTELATGLHYQQNGQWLDSKEEIDILPNGTAAATQGQHQAYFPGDIYTGQIELVTPDGQQLHSRPLELSYFDGTNIAMIAELTNSIGQVLGDNQVIYTNAFSGLNADLVYTYKKSGFEQDVVLRQQPPTPESLGLNPDTARLQVLTEFFAPPQPTVRSTALPAQAGLALTDESLGFGTMQMVPGRAFLLGRNAADAGARVGKQWVVLEGRQFLVEEVPVDAIVDGLAALPLTALNTGSGKPSHTASRHLTLPSQRLAKNNTSKTMLMAKAESRPQGFVLDYQTVNSSLTNFTFQGDMTYYLSGTVNLSGTNTFEGGTVLKYASNASLIVNGGQLNWQAGMYRPAVFTAIDDNSVGETISGSTGIPSGYYASAALLLSGGVSGSLANIRIAYAHKAVSLPSQSFNISDAQFVNCQAGISIASGSANLENALFSGVQTNFSVLGGSIIAQNVTFSTSSYLAASPVAYSPGLFPSTTLSFTNCSMANISVLTNNAGGMLLNGNYNGFYNMPHFGGNPLISSRQPFLAVGAGSYYLTNGCSFLNAGTTNIDPVLLADIRTKTTYPPIVYSNVTISAVTTFSPQAQRDTDTPDLGYHYDPLDYVFGGVTVYSNMTFTAGTAVGYFELPGSGGPGYGISIYDNVMLALNGTASQPCTLARYSTVQEGGNGLWQDKGWLAAIAAQSLSGGYGMSPGNAAQIWPSFTHHYELAGDPNFYREYNALIKVNANNSEFETGAIGPYWGFLNFTNCLFDRSILGIYGGALSSFAMRNCTMHGGSVTLQKYGNTWPVWIEESAFDLTALAVDDNSSGNININYGDFNGYVTNQTQLPGTWTHNVIVSNFTWQASWLGNFYQPTNSMLINAGSTTADQVGLYHFTTQTNQVKEGDSIVDIGYHYVATDAYGNPVDTNGDGIPDYLEDANGNGLVDSGEIDWNITGDLGLQVIITRPRNGSILP